MIPGLDKEQTGIALIFRDLLAKGDVPEADWRKLYAANSSGLSFKKFQAKIKAELTAFAHFLLNTEFPEPGPFLRLIFGPVLTAKM